MVRGERPIKRRDSWFSAKSILVERLKNFSRGRDLDKQWWHKALLSVIKLRILAK